MRRAAKVDNNHVECVLALKRAGYLVYRVSDAALPDLWITHPQAVERGWLPLEIKGPDGTLTPAQQKWWQQIGEAAGEVVRSPQAALEAAHAHFFGRTDGSSSGGDHG